MTVWTQQEREQAYSSLCDAITAAGRDKERLFLARLCLLLAEELSDGAAFATLLVEAKLPQDEGGAEASG